MDQERHKEGGGGGDAGKELMQIEITKKGGGRLNVNLLLTIPFYCNGCETLWFILCVINLHLLSKALRVNTQAERKVI